MNDDIKYNNEIPLVSIVTLSYNMSKFIIKTIECVKNQTYPAIEHIIIDDASTDGSGELIEEWIKRNNYKCTFIKREKNVGVVGVINDIMKLAHGKYYCEFSDDLCTNDRIEKQVKLFNNDDSIAFVYGNCNLIDENDNYLKTYLDGNYVPPNNLYLSLLSLEKGVGICTPSVLFNLKILRDEGGFTSKYVQGDYDVFLRLTKKHKIVYGNAILVSYRMRSDSFTKTPKWMAPMRRDVLYLLMDMKQDSEEEKIALKKGLVNGLKSAYYYANTLKIDNDAKEDLYKAVLSAIRFLGNNKFPLSFNEKMLLFFIKNKIPYKYAFKLMKTLNPEFKM